jgi:hypothetical protein
MKTCRLCRCPGISRWLDLGTQPISNRFMRSSKESEYKHGLAIGCCPHCATVQLAEPMPADEVRPRFDWISYNEPERHLDQLADDIVRLPGLTSESTICGISYKDESLLRRLKERGLKRTWTIDMHTDLGVDVRGAGIETIQETLTANRAAGIVARHGPADVVIMRHVLEHAHDYHQLLDGLKRLTAAGGYLIFEVPDAQRALTRLDYSTIWEEHIFYFTPATLRHGLKLAGLVPAYFRSFPYTLEDSLVVAVQPTIAPVAPRLRSQTLQQEIARAGAFVEQFDRERKSYRAFVENFRRQRGKIAFLGAGHLSCALINYFELAEWVEFVVDDNPHKKGLFMPGSRLPIVGSDALMASGIKLCYMSVRPEIEAAVVDKNRAFLNAGGQLVSIFPDSPFALNNAAA